MASATKRQRACEACHGLKIKCEPGPSEGGCERCVRLSIPCVPSARRWQRDRIAELEAQVSELTQALQSKYTSTSSGWTGSPSSAVSLSATDQAANSSDDILSFIDTRLSATAQETALQHYASRNTAVWPVVPLPTCSLEQVRAETPVLFLAILAFPVAPALRPALGVQQQTEFMEKLMSVLGKSLVHDGRRSLELVQALLVAAFWYRPARNKQHASCNQLVQLALDMAYDTGIAGPEVHTSPEAYFSRLPDATSLNARRTWLACFIATTTMSLSTRRRTVNTWTNYHEDCVAALSFSDGILPTDALLCHLCGILKLCLDMFQQLHIWDMATFEPIDAMQPRIENLQHQVHKWETQLPYELASNEVLIFWKRVVSVYLYEAILHTPTNKINMGAPYVPERIIATDFPAPEDISEFETAAIYSIEQGCRLAIDAALACETASILDMPAQCFGPSVTYSLSIMIKLYVCITAPGNTYGRVLSPDYVPLRAYLEKVKGLAWRLEEVDPDKRSFNTCLIGASLWLEAWLGDYQVILGRYMESLIDSSPGEQLPY